MVLHLDELRRKLVAGSLPACPIVDRFLTEEIRGPLVRPLRRVYACVCALSRLSRQFFVVLVDRVTHELLDAAEEDGYERLEPPKEHDRHRIASPLYKIRAVSKCRRSDC